ncbi:MULTISPECIES: PucR family transcriptional regulator [Dietzia]|uniref:PucR family transcriptional regulator n=1 Tax=Dietzia TaxID=37914 RepID=UPI000783BA84|nr:MULTISPECIES: helix-turn-helix domain-containing protein [Dietzia]MCT2058472.1 helix-turn-helix domain-containing protein [Dietzia cinnamea]MCT2121960.1 helix-turn-helix domain-containing protein [Dietzia cinnamea]MCT2146085.1 helix-turn-helix domain-containing protein [Dietzia cinnamea]MCT2305404.1 helix-turn-helix domain-containing protein [Dietzia cinnamea]
MPSRLTGPGSGEGPEPATPRRGRLTVCELAAAVGASIVTEAADTDAPLDHVVDAGTTAELQSGEMPLRAEETRAATGVVVLRWDSARPGGPLPDLAPILAGAFGGIRPAAVVVTPARTVNPPRAVIDQADRLDIALLWDRSGNWRMIEQVRRALEVESADVRESGSDEFSARLLAVADDLVAICNVLGEAIGARVELRLTGVRSRVGRAPRAISVEVSRRAELVIDPERELDEAGLQLVETARPLLAVHARVSDETDDERRLEASRTLRDILGDDLALREQAIRRSKRLNLFGDQYMLAMAIELFNVPVDLAGLRRLRSEIALVAARMDPNAATMVKDGLGVVLISGQVDLSVFLRDLCRTVKVPIAVGAGDPVPSPRGFPGSFRQARRAVAVGRRIGAINRLTRHSELGVLALLYQLPEHARREFVTTTLGSIADSTAGGQEQRRVLRVLQATDCNVSESARRLFVHPNTLRAKVSRIEDITGPFLADPKNRLTVFTALMMYALDSNSEE